MRKCLINYHQKEMLIAYVSYIFILLQVAIGKSIKDKRNRWQNEIYQSYKNNIIRCPTIETTLRDIYSISIGNHTISHLESILVAMNIPHYNDKEVQQFKTLHSTITKANNGLYEAGNKRSYNLKEWGAEKESRWEVPIDHPGQMRANCIKQTMLATNGTKTKFYDSYKNINRMSYLIYKDYGYIHPAGTVGFKCGYYKGYEGCETRWDIGKDWWNKCNNFLSNNQLTWKDLWITNHNTKNDIMINNTYKACADSSIQAIELNKTTVPSKFDRVFVISALWDFNYHHFMADSLARLIKYKQFLHQNPDIYIHIRAFEEYDIDPIKTEKEKYHSRLMRNRMFTLLDIDLSRIIYGPVLAKRVYIPRALHCSYTLSNPLEIRLLAYELLKASYKKLMSSQHSNNITNDLKDLNNQHRIIINNKSAKMNITWNMIIQQRHNEFEDARDWANSTYDRVISAFQSQFINHKIIKMQSISEQYESYCLYCAIIEYHNANVLVGMHGAGLTNMIFMPKGSLIIELVGEFTDVNMPLCGYYGTLAAVMGHHHYLYAHSYNWPPGWPDFDPTIPAKESYSFYQQLHYKHS